MELVMSPFLAMVLLFLITPGMVCHAASEDLNINKPVNDGVSAKTTVTEMRGFMSAESGFDHASVLDDDKQLGCLKQTYGRGAGVPIHACPADHPSQENSLCYVPCNEGYTGNAFLCWANCPDGFPDTPITCTKPPSYGRGGGYCWPPTAQGQCEGDYGAGNCEKWGSCWYPKCAPNFHNVLCCTCSPNCPDGWNDFGVGCSKPNYDRGVGVPLICAPDEVLDGGLCYPRCGDGYNGVGPVCWANGCPSAYPEACGPFCAAPGTGCDKVATGLGVTSGEALLSVAGVALCAITTFETFGAASACFIPAIAAVSAAGTDVKDFWQDSMAGYCR